MACCLLCVRVRFVLQVQTDTNTQTHTDRRTVARTKRKTEDASRAHAIRFAHETWAGGGTARGRSGVPRME